MVKHLKASKLHIAVLLALAFGTLRGSAQVQLNYNFNDNQVPPGTATLGTPGARVADGVLHLTDDGVGGAIGMFSIPDPSAGATIYKLNATWRSLIGGVNQAEATQFGLDGADGYSLSWGADLAQAGVGEEGTGSGLIVAVDTFDNGGFEAPGIDIKWKGTRVAFELTAADQTAAKVFLRKSQFVDASLSVSSGGRATFTYDGKTITASLADWAGMTAGSFMFGGRTGGAHDNHWIDDLNIVLSSTPEPVVFLAEPADATVLEGRTATFRATLDGTPPYTLQWLRNGEPITGANSLTLSFAASLADNGAVYSLRAENSVGTATSRGATLTVIDDNAAPVPVLAVGSATLDKVTIQFDEELEASGAGDPFNYGISGGLAVTAAMLVGDRSVILTVNPAQAENTVYTVTIGGVSDLAGNAIGSASIDFRSFLVGCGGLLFESYGPLSTADNNLDTTLLVNPNYPSNPRERLPMPVFDTRSVYPDNSHEGYGARVRGLFIPPVSGDWVFYLASDDSSRLFLNPNGPSAAGKVLIAQEPGCCGGWTAHTSLMTPGYGRPIPLTAGQAYFIEAIYKEGTGGDYLKVAARLTSEPAPADNPNQQIPISENAIPGSMLGAAAPAGIAGTVTITQQPADQTVEENRPATFTVAATNPNDLLVCYQWRRDGVDIAGATGPSHTNALAQLSDDGAVYDVLVSMIGDRTMSASATLRVTNDVTPPTVASVKGTANLQTIIVRFDERVEPVSAVDPFNYQVTDSGGNVISVTNITLLADGATVELRVDTRQTPGAAYNVRIDGISDLKGNPMVPVDKTFNAFVLAPGFALRELYFGFGGVAIADLRNHASYPFSPGLTDYSPLLEGPLDSYNNYGERISGYFVPPVSGNYNFYISSDDAGEFWLSTDANPANMVRLAYEPQWNAYRDWTGTAARRNAAAPENRSTTLFPAGIPLVAGQFYYFEALMKEGGGGDNLGVAVQYPDGPLPANGSQPISGAFIASPVDPEGASVTITQHPTDATATECRTATFTVAAQGSIIGNPNAPLSYRWQKDTGAGFADLLDAPNSLTLTVFARSSDNGAKYRAIVYVPGAEAASATATLTVAEDTEAPLLVSAARGCLDTTRITVQFNEPMDAASMGDVFNYSVEGVVLASATVSGPQSVVLTAASGIPDNYCGKITINNVTDCGGLAVASNTSTELGIEKPRSEVDGLLVIEAENYDAIFPGSGSSPEQWLFRTDKAGYSGAGAMASLPDNGGTSPSPTQLGQSPRMRYCVNFTSAGTKYIWIRGAAGPSGGSGDSLHLGTNGAHRAALTGWGAAFGWARNIQGGLGGNTFVVAAPGPYIIDIWMREDGTYIDKLLFRSDASGTAPAGQGPAETPRPGPYDPPTVAITSPAEGAEIQSCASVTIAANASTPCGSIVSVEFFANGFSLGSDNSSPYEINVTAYPPGDYALTAKVTDNHGLQATSTAVNVKVIYVNRAPSFTTGPSPVTAAEDSGPQTVSGYARDINKGSSCEAEQVLTFEVSNDNPGLFTTPPALDPATGDLTFQSAPNANGVANVTAVLADNGGTENGGQDRSPPATFQIQITPVNDCPVAVNLAAEVNEDSSVSITLAGADVDNDPLTFVVTSQPTHGVLSGLTYTPAPDYCGPDGFTYVANDGQCNSDTASVSITVVCVPDPPTNCVAEVSPAECGLLFGHRSERFVISLNSRGDVCLVLSGSAIDPEGDPVTLTWSDNGQPVATGSPATNCFPLGCHTVTMTAADPDGASCSASQDFCVITAAEAVEQCILLVETTQVERRNKRPLIVTLKAAKAAFDRDGWGAGFNMLNAFKHKVEAQIARNNPAEAQAFIQCADNIMAAVDCVRNKAPQSEEE